jgi:tetratricopeptide (TPR) repeat protein
VYYRLGKIKKAEDYILEALQYIEDNAIIYDHLGEVYYRQGRLDEAAAQWQKALELEEDNEELLRKLERVRGKE